MKRVEVIMVASTHRSLVAIAALAALLALSGCSDEVKPSSLGPEATFKAFFNAAWLHAQDQFQSDRLKAFDLLDRASREALETRAATLSASSPGAATVAPHELLVVASLPLGTPIQRIEMLEETEHAATLQVLFGRGEAKAHMIREDGLWRVSLLRPSENGK
jgi:hypothetical protein